MSRRGLAPTVLVAASALLAACVGGGADSRGAASSGPEPGAAGPASVTADRPDPSNPAVTDPALSGGEGTVLDTSGQAFSLPLRTLPAEDRRAFAVGNNFFNDNWVTAPASTAGRDGLGPTFNAQSCSSCHFRDGRAQPPEPDGEPELGLLLRLSVPGPDGHPQPVPGYGGQLQDRSVNGVPAEGRVRITYSDRAGAFSDGDPYTLRAPTYDIVDAAFGPLPPDLQISPRVAPAVFGVGLLEAVPEADVVALADPDDADGDGISGRANRVDDARTGGTSLGRFGWKANVPSVEQQNAGAFNADIGITSAVFPDENCPAEQAACAASLSGGSPELDDTKLARVTFYTRTLAVPARRDVGGVRPIVGEELFTSMGCAACHVPELRTGSSDVAALSDQVIRPYTDLLLHDMGPDLADGRPDGEATGGEWRTAPLWGIGLIETVNGHTRFLHDGRARNLSEAILWHGGEGAPSRDAFRALPAARRVALITFLESL